MNTGKIYIKIFLTIMGLFIASFSSSAVSAEDFLTSPAEAISPMPEIEESAAPVVSEANYSETSDQLTTRSLWKRFVNRYQQASLKVKILVVIIIYLLVSLGLLMIFILTNRTIMTIERARLQKMKETYQEELTNFLFGEENQAFEFTGIGHKANREVFINELLSLHNNLYGEAATRLRDLYYNLELYRDSIRKVKNGKWNVKAKGFKELAQMDVKDANRDIADYVNSRNQILRMEAQLALVKLNEEEPLGFLDDLKFELTEWEQVNILNTLSYHQINIDSFEPWMSSENDSVVIFATKLAGLYKHIHSWPMILELLEHENPKVRHVAIKTLEMFEVAENSGPFKEIFKLEQPLEEKEDEAFYNLNMDRNRLAAIEALEAVATPDDIPFLEQILKTEKEFNILKKAVSILNGIKPRGPEALDQVFERADPELRKIIENTKQTAAQ